MRHHARLDLAHAATPAVVVVGRSLSSPAPSTVLAREELELACAIHRAHREELGLAALAAVLTGMELNLGRVGLAWLVAEALPALLVVLGGGGRVGGGTERGRERRPARTPGVEAA